MVEQCPYNITDGTTACGFTASSMDMLKMHERAMHNGPKEITIVIKETT